MSWVAVAVGGAAVVGGAASYYGTKKQAGAVESGTRMSVASLERMQDKQLQLLQEAVDRGEIDINEAYTIAQDLIDPLANKALSYMEDPSQIWDLPGVEFQFQQGEKALENILSKTSGGGLSGRGIKAAIEYGQGFASTKINEALNRIMPYIGMSASLATDKGRNLANLRIAGAGGQASAVGQAGSAISQAYGAQGTNLANITGGMYSNISNVLSSGAENYALYRALKPEAATFTGTTKQ